MYDAGHDSLSRPCLGTFPFLRQNLTGKITFFFLSSACRAYTCTRVHVAREIEGPCVFNTPTRATFKFRWTRYRLPKPNFRFRASRGTIATCVSSRRADRSRTYIVSVNLLPRTSRILRPENCNIFSVVSEYRRNE